MHWAITGGTGFLGVHLLHELLQESGTFTLLVRPQPDPVARLQKALALVATDGHGWSEEDLRERFAVVPVDFGKRYLGLPEQQFKALADRVDAVLHCAGNTKLDGDPATLRRANVDGTARMLELVEAGSGQPDLFHMSTAFVAGRHRTGIVYEDDFADDAGFENNYEQSKFEAESLVRDWAQRTGRRVVILRPSILVTDQPPDPNFPLHSLSYLSKVGEAAQRLLSISGQLNVTPRVRVSGDPNGHLNFMPVGEAAQAMVRVLRLAPDGLSTYHIVHHHDVPGQTLLDVFYAVSSVRFSVVNGPIEDPSPLEKHLRWSKGFMPYLTHSRIYDTTGVKALLGEPGGRTVVDVDYLLDGVGRYKESPAVERVGSEPRKSAVRAEQVERLVPQIGSVEKTPDKAGPLRGLTFIVTVGRSGSTALSQILSAHRDVLSLNEFYLSVRTSLKVDQPVTGEQFWRVLADPHPVFDAMVRGGAGMPEFVYPHLKNTRFDANKTGIPAISMMTLPHLSPDPDGVFDALAAEVPTWPRQLPRLHYQKLFGWLAARFGGTVVVERSGMSLGSVSWLREMFPDARFVHLFRHGPDTAVSMSQHTGFRLMALIEDALALLDLNTEESRSPALRLDPAAIPIDLAPVLGNRCDVDYLMSQDFPVARFARMWSDLVAIGVAALADLPAARYLSLSYSDLVAEPRSTLTRLAAFLDIEAHSEWLDFGAGVIDPSFTGVCNQLSAAELQEVIQGCASGEALLRNHTTAVTQPTTVP